MGCNSGDCVAKGLGKDFEMINNCIAHSLLQRPSRPGNQKGGDLFLLLELNIFADKFATCHRHTWSGGHMFTERITVFKQNLASFEAQNTACQNAKLETFRKVESVHCIKIHESPVILLAFHVRRCACLERPGR